MKVSHLNGVSGRLGFPIRLFGTLLAVILLVYLLSQQGWQEIGEAIRQISLWQLTLALGLMMVSRLAVAGRWYVLLRSSGVKMPFGQSIRITFAGLFASNFLPTTIGGDVIRLTGALQLRLDAAICTASLIVDRLVGMAGMAMVVPFGLPRFLGMRETQSALSDGYPLVAGLIAAPLGKWWKAIWEKSLKLARRLLAALSLWLKQPRSLLIALAFTWVHMLCFFGIIFLLFEGMGQHVPFWQVGGLYSIVYFVTLLPFSINGYGIQEVSMTFIFSSVGEATVQSGLMVALLFRTLTMIASLPGAAYIPALLPQAKKQAEANE